VTHIFRPDWREKEKWRKQAKEAAAHLKKAVIEKDPIVIGFVFDDGLIKITIRSDNIRSHTEQELAEHIYNVALTAAQTGGTA
jgi:hypothetical protein